MQLSIDWLSDYIKLPPKFSAENLARDITLKCAEIEKVALPTFGKYRNFVVGQILKISTHPNASKVRITQTDVGDQKLQILCGASNIEEGQKVAVALIGAKIGSGREAFTICKRDIRGVSSAGMICSADELELSTQRASGILVLDSNIAVGTPLDEILATRDTVLEIDNHNITHRADLWGHKKWAQEISAITDYPLKPEAFKLPKLKYSKTAKQKIKIEATKLCKRLIMSSFSGVKIRQSPAWLQERLRASGVKVINSIVDITNYVMLDIGHPAHAFDADMLHGAITIRTAHDREKIMTLDGEERSLTKDMLVVADERGPQAVAGVMGGETAMVADSTSNILFETATFDAISVRKTSTKLRLRSDASSRFEKGLQIEQTEEATQKIVALMHEVHPEAKLSFVIQAGSTKEKCPVITLAHALIEKNSGYKIKTSSVKNILTKLGCTVVNKTSSDHKYKVTIPWWRRCDLSEEIDLVEEVLRVAGYDKVPIKMPVINMRPPEHHEVFGIRRKLKNKLVALGFQEVLTYPFATKEDLLSFTKDEKKLISVRNPLVADENMMRSNLLPNLLKIVKKNQRELTHMQFFEIGRVFESGLPLRHSLQNETHYCAGMLTAKSNKTPFHKMKSLLEELFEQLGVEMQYPRPTTPPDYLHPVRSVILKTNQGEIGYLGEIHPTVLKQFGVKQNVCCVEFDVLTLNTTAVQKILFKATSKFPAVERDLALIVNKRDEYRTVADNLRKMSGPLVRNVRLFDVYQGDQIPSDKKSMALRIIFQSEKETLTDDTVNKIMQKTISGLDKYGWTLRQ